MKGLLRDNFYASYENEKVFFVVIFLVGIVLAVVCPGTMSVVTNYMLVCMGGFSYVSLDSLRKDSTCKWEKYKLTMPVTRTDIVKSRYMGHLLWVAAGVACSGIPLGLFILWQKFSFDLNTDLPLVYIAGVSISLFMGAIFFPLFYLCGEERKEAVLVISILLAVAVAAGLVALLNYLFGPGMSPTEIILSGLVLLACAVLTFGLSFLLTVKIFGRKGM